MKVGYARTSTLEQVAGFDAQIRDLTAAGCEKVFKEQVSSVSQREQLNTALDFIRDGDTLVVTKLDRLARSTQHLLDIIGKLKAKGGWTRNLVSSMFGSSMKVLYIMDDASVDNVAYFSFFSAS